MAEALLHDLRYAARAMIRASGLTLVAILTLALGIGATTTMFSGVGDLDPRMLIGVAAIMLGVAFIAAFLPACRAGAIDPLTVLRHDA
jgi:putative ABC transport system permease protein